MKEIVERVETIFSELGYDIFEQEENEEVYQASFGKGKKYIGSFFIENNSNFLELAYTFTFDVDEERFLRDELESMLDICYEYGCYFSIMKGDNEIHFSVFSKLYFSGLNVESLGDTLEDFVDCTQELAVLFEMEEGDEGKDSEEVDRDN
jgi:hypothetical protein